MILDKSWDNKSVFTHLHLRLQFAIFFKLKKKNEQMELHKLLSCWLILIKLSPLLLYKSNKKK